MFTSSGSSSKAQDENNGSGSRKYKMETQRVIKVSEREREQNFSKYQFFSSKLSLRLFPLRCRKMLPLSLTNLSSENSSLRSVANFLIRQVREAGELCEHESSLHGVLIMMNTLKSHHDSFSRYSLQ
jgi:hypothetical protein